MAAQTSSTTSDTDINALLLYVTLRSGILQVALTQHEPADEQTRAVEELDSKIKRLVERYATAQGEAHLKKLLLKTGYHLDFYPSARPDSFTHIYLGHIVEQRVTPMGESGHTFLLCHSNQKGFLGAGYPLYVQREKIRIYTRGEITWVEGVLPLDYAGKEEPRILRGLPLNVLEQMRTDGEINYRSIGSRHFHPESVH